MEHLAVVEEGSYFLRSGLTSVIVVEAQVDTLERVKVLVRLFTVS